MIGLSVAESRDVSCPSLGRGQGASKRQRNVEYAVCAEGRLRAPPGPTARAKLCFSPIKVIRSCG
jgi:hypothetical protein